jgi:NADPH:quinone reductase-like Zn-dependent oxidoreductase
VNAYDWHLLRAKPFFTRRLSGIFKPKNNILGADVAGTVEALGTSTAHCNVGDRVFGCLESCGKGGLAAGGFAEYVCAKESVIAPIPDKMSFEQAAAIPMAGSRPCKACVTAENSKRARQS